MPIVANDVNMKNVIGQGHTSEKLNRFAEPQCTSGCEERIQPGEREERKPKGHGTELKRRRIFLNIKESLDEKSETG